MKTLKKIGDEVVRWVRTYPVTVIVCTLVVCLAVYSFSILHPFAVLSKIGRLFPIGRAGTFHLVNLVALAGVIFSGLGFWYTYFQLRDNNDRIEGYRDFYEWVRQLFKEIENGEATEFYFYGPTILPGNVAYGDAGVNDIGQFQKDLNNLFKKFQPYQHVISPVIIVPPIEWYEESYRHFLNARMSHHKDRSPGAWEKFVIKKRDAAKEYQATLNVEHRGEILTPVDDRSTEINGAYFLSNGRRIIFAKPLHYASAPKSRWTSKDDGLREQSPHLVGFTSKVSVTVDAFQEHFMELTQQRYGDLAYSRERDLLRKMYSKHLVSPRYLEKMFPESEPVTLEQVSMHDHDHFGGKDSTDKFLDAFEIGPGDRVLDIGSGLGGPARYIAAKRNCLVVGVELQTERHQCSEKMTKRLKLDDLVKFYNSDVCDEVERIGEKYKYAVAFLSILHLQKKERFLRALGARIENGGAVYIEDYVRNRILDAGELNQLAEVIACPGLLTREEYVAALAYGGLDRVMKKEDVTDDWMRCAKERMIKLEHKEEGGTATKDEKSAQKFNRGVVELFESGIIRGMRLVVEKAR